VVAGANNGEPATGGKRDRDEVFVEYTKSICPVCKVVVDAQVNIRNDKVYLRKRCHEHGWFEAQVYGDAQAYLSCAPINKPGTIPLTFQTEVHDGCPSDCGLCPEHKQHACLGIIEVNTNCNLDCLICFVDSGHQPDGYAITRQQCEWMLDTFVAAEGEAEVVMFSGGKPTIHQHILHFIDAAQARLIRNVALNTNGIRLATDTCFVTALGERNGRNGKSINVYLQFDGLEERTHREIRGRDLREIKQRALDNCAHAGLTVTLAAAVEWGLNEHELACGVNLPEAIANLTDRAFMIVVQDFQDPYTLNVKQLMKCYVAEITPDGRLIPFCAYNSVGYREQVREQMSGVAVADVVPNATELQPLLAASPSGSKIARSGAGHCAMQGINVGRRAARARVSGEETDR
jgi:uncharacterized radical SAM superfamily Fe-S cluster-containing enzyme